MKNISSKLISVSLLLCIALLVSGASPLTWFQGAVDTFKASIALELEAVLGREVTIGGIKGINVYQVELLDVGIAEKKKIKDGTALWIKRVVISYNPAKLALLKGNVLGSITTITLFEPDIYLCRQKDGTSNLGDFLSGQDNASRTNAQPIFTPKIYIKNGRGLFRDKLGFKDDPLPSPFDLRIKEISGLINLNKAPNIFFDIDFKTGSPGRTGQAQISGKFDRKKEKIFIDAGIKNLDLAKWANYLANLKDLNVAGGGADLALKISGPPNNFNSLSYSGTVRIFNGKGKYQGSEISGATGNIKINGQDINIEKLSALFFDAPVKASGRLEKLGKKSVDLSVSSEAIPLDKISRSLPRLEDLKLQGTGKIQTRVTGTISNPTIDSRVEIINGKLLGQKISATADLGLYDKILNLEVREIKALDGFSSVKGIINYNEKVPAFKIIGSIESFDVSLISPEAEEIEGKASGLIEAAGNFNDYSVFCSLDFESAYLFGENINQGNASIEVKEGHVLIKDLSLRGENTELSMQGAMENDLLNLKTDIKDLRLSGKIPVFIKTAEKPFLSMSVSIESFNGDIALSLGEDFLRDPVNNIRAHGRIKFINGKIEDQSLDLAEGRIDFDHGEIEFDGFSVHSGDSRLLLSGKIGAEGPENLMIKGFPVDLEEIKLLNAYLPEYAEDPKGISHFEIELSRKETAEVKDAAPLSDLNIKGKASLTNGRIAGEDIISAEADFEWKERNLDLKYLFVKTPLSEIVSAGKIKRDGAIDLSIGGKLDLKNIAPLTAKYGKISGIADLKGELKGSRDRPEITCDFLAKNIQWNELHIEMITGKAVYSEENLIFERPVSIFQKDDVYRISGGLNLRETLGSKDEWVPPGLDIKIEIIKGALDTAVLLSEMINREFIARKAVIGGRGKINTKINTAALKLPHISGYKQGNKYLIYASDGIGSLPPFFLQAFESSLKESEELKKEEIIKPRNIGGKFTGTINLGGERGDISGDFSIKTENGHFENYNFDRLELFGKINRGIFDIESLTLRKSEGRIKVRGLVGIKDKINLKISAENFPVDFLKIILKSDKPFIGKLNGSSVISGEIRSLNGSGSFDVTQGNIANVLFEKASAEFILKDNLLNIKNISVFGKDKRNIAKVSGLISLDQKKSINLFASFKDNGIGLLTIPVKEISFVESRGEASFTLGGTTGSPNINGNFNITNASLSFPKLKSLLEKIRAKINIKDNFIAVKELRSVLRGKITEGKENAIGISGSVNLANAFEEKAIIDFDLKLADADYFLNIDEFYRGGIKIKDIHLSGPMYLTDPEENEVSAVLSGKVALSKGSFYYGEPKEGAALPPFGLDLVLDLNENLNIVGGDQENLMAPDFSNVILNLEAEAKDISIRGSLRQPSLTGRITFKGGRVNILNRDFSLISLEEQRTIYRDDPDRIKVNDAVFSGSKGKEGTIPNINLFAKVKVKGYIEEQKEEISPVETAAVRQEDVLVIANVKGMPFIADPDKGIKINLEAFIEDTTIKPPKLVASDYSQEEMRTLLLPDYIKAELALKKGGLESVTAKTVLVDYLNSRLQLIILRGVEREVEKTLGLERLTLEYDFGKDLERLFPGGEEARPDEFYAKKETVWGVGAGKGFFGRLFIDVRYAESLEEKGETQAYSNYQITYKLTPIWSVVYYKEPLFPSLGYPYYQITLELTLAI